MLAEKSKIPGFCVWTQILLSLFISLQFAGMRTMLMPTMAAAEAAAAQVYSATSLPPQHRDLAAEQATSTTTTTVPSPQV